MATALTIINRALSLLGVKTAGVELTNDEINDGIEVLNDMMLEFDVGGLRLGYSVVSSSSDLITSPDWSHAMMKSQLALRLAPEYDRTVSPALFKQAKDALRTVKKKVIRIGAVSYPSTYPIGSGNEIYTTDSQYPFYPDKDVNDLLYENSQGATTQRDQQIDVDLEDNDNVS